MIIEYTHPSGRKDWADARVVLDVDPADLPRLMREAERDMRRILRRVEHYSDVLGAPDALQTLTMARRVRLRIDLDIACSSRDGFQNRLDALRVARTKPTLTRVVQP